jgi:hypothetical protein
MNALVDGKEICAYAGSPPVRAIDIEVIRTEFIRR